MSHYKVKQKSIFDILKEKLNQRKNNIAIITEDFMTFETIKDVIDFKNPAVIFISEMEQVYTTIANDDIESPVFLIDIDVLTKYNIRMADIEDLNLNRTVIVFSSSSIQQNIHDTYIKSEFTFGLVENFEKNCLSLNVMIENAIKSHFKSDFFKHNTDAIDKYLSLFEKPKNITKEVLVDRFNKYLMDVQGSDNVEYLVFEKRIHTNVLSNLSPNNKFGNKTYKEDEDVSFCIAETLKEKKHLTHKEYQTYYFSNDNFREIIFIFKGVNSATLISRRLLNTMVTLNANHLLTLSIENLKENVYQDELKELYLRTASEESLSQFNSLSIFFEHLQLEEHHIKNMKSVYFARELKIKNVPDIVRVVKFLDYDDKYALDNPILKTNKWFFIYFSIFKAIDIIQKVGVKEFLDDDFGLSEEVISVIRENIILFDF